jgi:hypothetical protein
MEKVYYDVPDEQGQLSGGFVVDLRGFLILRADWSWLRTDTVLSGLQLPRASGRLPLPPQ